MAGREAVALPMLEGVSLLGTCRCPLCWKPEAAATDTPRPCLSRSPAGGRGLWSEGPAHSPALGCPTLSPGEGLLEPGGLHRGPALPVCGDACHGGGHGLDLPAGHLQPASTAAFPRGPLLLPGAGQALHLERACSQGSFGWGFRPERDGPWGGGAGDRTGARRTRVSEKGQALPGGELLTLRLVPGGPARLGGDGPGSPETRRGSRCPQQWFLCKHRRVTRESLRVDIGWGMGQDDLGGGRGLAQGPGRMPLRLAFWDPSVRKMEASSGLPLPRVGVEQVGSCASHPGSSSCQLVSFRLLRPHLEPNMGHPSLQAP